MIDQIEKDYSIYYPVDVVNLTLSLISLFLCGLILIILIQMRKDRKKMGWILIGISLIMCGQTFQLVLETSDERYMIHAAFARMCYALVAPVFTLYFIETEQESGEKWDHRFWLMVQFLIAVLVGATAILGEFGFFTGLAFLFQYVVGIVMLLMSSKSIKASMSFVIGEIFPIGAAIGEMTYEEIDVVGFGITMLYMVVFFSYQLETDREILQSQAELSEKRVSLLMEQIHPHFIYNSLQQIALLSDEDAKAVKPAILNFSGYLRRKFQALTGDSMIPFEEEMEHVDMYIELADILPSRKFVVEKNLQVTDFKLPPLTLQPLVENAIQYGIGMSEEGDRIRIRSFTEGGYIKIQVIDDGHGKKTRLPTQKAYKSVGTENVRTRLKLLCNGELSIRKLEQGTEAEIRIPEG